MAGINSETCSCGGGKGTPHEDWCCYPYDAVAGHAELYRVTSPVPQISAAGRAWDASLERANRNALVAWVRSGRTL